MMATRKQLAKDFVDRWSKDEKGREDADRQSFWIDLLEHVFGIQNTVTYLDFEKNVRVKFDGKIRTKHIDVYIPSTKVMIEMKGKNKAIDEKIKQSEGTMLTAFEQANRYAQNLPQSEHPRWILISNFDEINIYDMNKPFELPKVIQLIELPNKFKELEFLIDVHQQKIINEEQVSFKAGELVAKIYNELSNAYALHADLTDVKTQRSLNMLIVRLVFLMYVDDSALFGTEDMFQHFLENRNNDRWREDLIKLFAVLDTPLDQRDPFLNNEYKDFPYVNGGMFSTEEIIIPQFTESLSNLILDEASRGFNWSNISPTIFGAVFESTLNPDTRRKGGMHYTSIENIHKVIDPLFLDGLTKELRTIQNMGNANQRRDSAQKYQDKLANLKFLDPACGSGNFLTETYLSIRALENEAIKIMQGNNTALSIDGTESSIKVSIVNFFGIEINDFAISVAKTAMWIAESQMITKSSDEGIYIDRDFFPLMSNTGIHEGNALHITWEDIVKPYELDYIMGNPPFIANNGRVSKEDGSSADTMSPEQKEDRFALFGKSGNVLDYVACWFYEAAKYVDNTTVKCAFVSTNSITQGQQAVALWKKMFEKGIHINFAYPSFPWDSEAKNSGTVFVVIVGFSQVMLSDKKYIFVDQEKYEVDNINAYLHDAPDIFIEKRNHQINSSLKMTRGSQPTDDGNLILSEAERDDFIQKYPHLKQYVHQFMMGNDFLNNKLRYCLWLEDITPDEIQSSAELMRRLKNVKEFRLNSTKNQTRKKANTPQLFDEIKNLQTNFVAVPIVSSGNRKYIPIGYLDASVIAGNKLFQVENTSLTDFGILTSIVHMAWMRETCSWYGPSYSYSNTIVFNNFPWPELSEKGKKQIATAAQSIIDIRAKYGNSSLSTLYNELSMPDDLQKAHNTVDKLVLRAYGLQSNASENTITEKLFQIYEKLVDKD